MRWVMFLVTSLAPSKEARWNSALRILGRQATGSVAWVLLSGIRQPVVYPQLSEVSQSSARSAHANRSGPCSSLRTTTENDKEEPCSKSIELIL